MSADAGSSKSTELVIFPTVHLTDQTPEAAVHDARERLIAWRPDLVAVELLPGHLVVEYEQRGGSFADLQVGGAAIAREAAELVGAQPNEIWPGRHTAMDNSAPVAKRVLGWLRAREPLNALLLPWRTADLSPAITEFLDRLERRPGEGSRIGAYVARSLGHQWLAHVDDHCGVENLGLLPPDFTQIRQWQQERLQPLIDQLDVPEQIEDLWELWERLSTARSREISERLESTEWVAGDLKELRSHRVMLANWRARNLAMAARIRSVTAAVPGGRVVFVVGFAHLHPLRRALERDQYDLRLVRLSELGP